MLTTTIGENAGALWKIIRDTGPIGFNSLKKLSRMDEKNLYLALGWLAREGKVAFDKTDNQITINLK